MTQPARTPVQDFPQITLPLTQTRQNQAGGFITQPWLMLLWSLWARTGAAQGGNSVPTGMVADFAGPAAACPAGWMVLPAGGGVASRTDLASLFGVLGETWGAGDGSTTFGLPPGNVFYQGGEPGTTGGAPDVTLTVGNLPAHNHPVIDPGHVHTALVAASTNTIGTAAGAGAAGNTGSSMTGITIGDTGSGDAFSILPPYAMMLKIIKL